MLSFHNDQSVKDKYVSRLKEHLRLDQIIQGTGFENGRGCAVGCTLDNYNHNAYETELGLPTWLAHLEDTIFEGLAEHLAPKFALDFLEAIPVGVDVELVQYKLAIIRHKKQLVDLESNNEDYAVKVKAAIQQVITYCEDMLNGTATEKQRLAAYSAADSAAAYSADSAARSAAYSAYSAADSAARSAAYSAYSAADSASRLAARSAADSAYSASRSAAYSAASEELIKLLKDCK